MLAAAVDDVWWRETTLLYTARSNADVVVTACLESGSITALALAFDVADDGDLAPELRRRLEELLSKSDDDPARRHLRAGVLVTRSLRRAPVRTNTGTRVCGVSVSPEVYRLFVTESGVPAATEPTPDVVTGVWARDAAQFVTWVNEVTDGLPGYRLATAAELDELSRRRKFIGETALSVWIQPDADRSTLWIPSSRTHPNHVDDETIRAHVHDDIIWQIPNLIYLALLAARRPESRYWWDSGPAKFATALIRELRVNNTFENSVGRFAPQSNTPNGRAVIHASRLLQAIELVKELDTALRRGNDLNHLTNLARKVAGHLAHARGLELSDDTAEPHEPDMMTCSLQPFLHSVNEIEDTHAWTGSKWFANKFISDTAASKAARIVTLDTLENTIHQATMDMRKRSSSNAIISIVDKLANLALPVAARAKPITSHLATAVRIAALSLAIEASRIGDDDISDKYREIAAAVTLIERRANGQAPPTETLILAVS